METMVLPDMENPYKRERARDELPQSGTGRTIMTAEPKFVPEEAAEIALPEGGACRVRLVDCVGYLVEGALGGMEGDTPRMVSTPWQEEPMTLAEAAEIGTHKIDKYPQKGYTNLTRGYGGIGRRARFRFWCPRRAGSSPVTRTSKKTLWNLSTAFFFCRFLLGQLALCLLLKALLGYDGALVRALTDQTCLIVCGNLEAAARAHRPECARFPAGQHLCGRHGRGR